MNDTIPPALTGKQQAFVEHYLECWSAAEAARRAGYSEKGVYTAGWRLLRNAEVRKAIEARLSEFRMSADEVLARLAEQAMASMDDFISPSGALDLRRARARGRLHLVKKYSKTKQGVSIELYDAQAALTHLGRTHGLFVDKTALTDPTGKKEYAGLSDDERAARVAALLDAARARRAGSAADGG